MLLFLAFPNRALRILSLTIFACLAATALHAHEAWLLTPAEIEALASEPMPYIFTSRMILGLAALIGCVAVLIALLVEEKLQPYEARMDPTLGTIALAAGPAILRLGLAAMLALAGTGGLPRHGVASWIEPTLLVPDMQLSLVAGWEFLAVVQIGIALLLAAGLLTRIASLALIVITCIGLGIFGADFLSYAPHFIAPALILIATGAGPLSVDHQLRMDGIGALPSATRQPVWRLSQILCGAGFIYLAVAYKLTQPTLLIAIIQHGDMPSFGIPYPVIALVMTGIEIICGAMLILGRLIRPVSLAIIGAITFLALTLGETPLFHANLYGMMILFGLAGRQLHDALPATPRLRKVWA